MHPQELIPFLASYAGIDGGNPDAPVWICGLEHGGGFEDLSALVPELQPGAWSATFRDEHPSFGTWPYHQKVAKFLVTLAKLRHEARSTPTVEGWREYMASDLYARGGDSFKLNLYPLASPAIDAPDWAKAYGAIPAFSSKRAYYELCAATRLPFLRALRARHRPRVVVCTGKTHESAFVQAFCVGNTERRVHWLESNGQRRQCAVLKDEIGHVLVTPFFGGRSGLNSDGLLIELATCVAELLDYCRIGDGGSAVADACTA